MPWELIYTSAPRGLQSGQSGLGTVAQTVDIPPALARKLEQISYYDHLAITRAARFSSNPAIAAHRIIDLERHRFHILSRLSDAGLDFTKRTNFLAQHLAFAEPEVADLPSPAQILRTWSGWRASWSENPHLLASEPRSAFLQTGASPLLPAMTWRRLAGEEGRAASLHFPPCSLGCYLEVPEGSEKDLLDLFCEALQIPVVAQRSSLSAWQLTFTTFLQAEDNPLEFNWRGGWPQSPGWDKESGRGALVLNPLHLTIPDHDYALIARGERVPVRSTTAGPAQPARPSRPSAFASIESPASAARPARLRVVEARLGDDENSPAAKPEAALFDLLAPHGRLRTSLVTATATLFLLVGILMLWRYARRPTPVPVQLGTVKELSMPGPTGRLANAGSGTSLAPKAPSALAPTDDLDQVVFLQIARDFDEAIDGLNNGLSGRGDEAVGGLVRLITQLEAASLPPGAVTCELATSNTITIHPLRHAQSVQEGPPGAILSFGLGGFRRWQRPNAESTLGFVPNPRETWTNGFASLLIHWQEPGAPARQRFELWTLKNGPGRPEPMRLELHAGLRIPPASSGPFGSFTPVLSNLLSRALLTAGWTWSLDLYTSNNPSAGAVFSRWSPEFGLPPPAFGEELMFNRQLSRLTNQLTASQAELQRKRQEVAPLNQEISEFEKGANLEIGHWFGVSTSNTLSSYLSFWRAQTEPNSPEDILQKYLLRLLEADKSNEAKLSPSDRHILPQRLRASIPSRQQLTMLTADFERALAHAGISPGENRSITNFLEKLRNLAPNDLDQYRSKARLASALNREIEFLDSKQQRLKSLLDEFPTGGLQDLHLAVLRITPTGRLATREESIDFIRFERSIANLKSAP